MGCHTWCYTPIEIPEKEEIKNFLFDLYEDYLQSFKDRWKNIIKNRIHKLKEDKIPIWQLEEWYFDRRGFTKENGKYYMETEYHDIFRCNDYDAPNLHSLEETIEFIKNNSDKCFGNIGWVPEKQKCVAFEINFDNIKEFWTKYPNGLITFG